MLHLILISFFAKPLKAILFLHVVWRCEKMHRVEFMLCYVWVFYRIIFVVSTKGEDKLEENGNNMYTTKAQV